MLNDDILSSPVVPLSKQPTLLRTPTPLALSEDILTPASDTSPPSLSLASTSGQDTSTDSSSRVSHTLEKRKYSTAADDHFHEYPSHAAITTTTTNTSNDPPVNTTSGEHAATSNSGDNLRSNSGDALRKILESRRRILELLARHAREEDSAIARLTKENTVYNKTLHHIPAPIFSRSSGSKRRGPFRRKGPTASWSSHSQKESCSDEALTSPRRPTGLLKVKIVLPSSPCSEVPKSPDYQADDELDELEEEDSLITGPASPSPLIKTKLSVLEPTRRNKRARHDHEYERAKAASSSPQHVTAGEPMTSEVRHQIQSHPTDSAPRQTKAVRFDDSLNIVVAYRAEDPAREVSFSSESAGDSSPPRGTIQQHVAWSPPSVSILASSSTSTSTSSAPPTASHPSPDPVSSLTSSRTNSSPKRKSSPCHPSDTPRPLKRTNRNSLSPPQPDHGPAATSPLPMLRRQSSSVSLLDTMSS